MKALSNTAVYGGAFTPPTIGHKAIIEALLQKKELTRIIVAPSGPRIDKVYAIEASIRRRLIELFIEEFGDSRVEGDFTFFDGTEDTTTLGMDTRYQERYGTSPYQVFGADVSHSMASWPNTPENQEYLLKELPKIFFSRPGVELKLDDKGSYEVIDAPIPDASSTLVREAGRIDLLTEKVRAEYLRILPKV